MNEIYGRLAVLLSTVTAVLIVIAPAADAASEKEKKVRGLMSELNKLEKQIRSAAKGLSSDDLKSLRNKFGSRRDSDDDGIADMVENSRGWSSCDSDSDDDGLDDNSELDLGSKPDDSDSDDDGIDDSDESSGGSDPTSVEATGFITAISSTQVSLDGRTFTFTSTTKFRDDEGNSISKGSFQVGDCAEAEGNFNSNSVLLAHELKNKGSSDDCN